ncbi:hypothetical protein KR054_002981 [Drosophila jambulina]|nr:hypothetical protein KR054_002981 [Drosophila jambulina]
MNWKFVICCLLGLVFGEFGLRFLTLNPHLCSAVKAIEARCLPRTGNMWQQQAPADDEEMSCEAPSLLHSVATASATAGAAPKPATAALDKGTPAVAITAPASLTLTNYAYLDASRPDNMAGTCSQQPLKLVEPESKPELTYPEWGCKQGLKQHELAKPEVPMRRTVPLTATEMEAAKLRWA